MSSIVSRGAVLRNQSNDCRGMSMRWGGSRTCLRREKDLRARGAATVWVTENSLPLHDGGAYGMRYARERAARSSSRVVRRRTSEDSGDAPLRASEREGAARD